jgi:hypothetical protein
LSASAHLPAERIDIVSALDQEADLSRFGVRRSLGFSGTQMMWGHLPASNYDIILADWWKTLALQSFGISILCVGRSLVGQLCPIVTSLLYPSTALNDTAIVPEPASHRVHSDIFHDDLCW